MRHLFAILVLALLPGCYEFSETIEGDATADTVTPDVAACIQSLSASPAVLTLAPGEQRRIDLRNAGDTPVIVVDVELTDSADFTLADNPLDRPNVTELTVPPNEALAFDVARAQE